MTIRGGILEEARQLTEGDRNKEYGDPKDQYGRIARVWSARLGVEITAHQAALMMVDVKLDRAFNNAGHHDSFVDGAAYMAIAGECAT